MPTVKRATGEAPPRKGPALWHDEKRHTPSLGCTRCPEFGVCGGLRVAASLFSCFDLCRCPPGACATDAVCRRSPASFADHFCEIGGFGLDNIPRAAVVAAPDLPDVAPFIYHGRRRAGDFRPAAAAVSLYSAVAWKDGAPRFKSGIDLRSEFGLAPNVPLVLSGTATDPTIERWWSHEAPRRRAAIAELRDAVGEVLVTTPNFSLFRDVPRWDDMHAMKRIAIAWWEFVDGGVPAALHLNGRTERDYERWARFVSDRPEVTHVAFEFGTSAGQPSRREWHAAQLTAFASAIGRPVHLVVRGGLPVLHRLGGAFPHITLLDTSAFMKTTMRRRLVPAGNARLKDEPAPTPYGGFLDNLLDENVRTIGAAAALAIAPPLVARSRA